MKDTTTGIVTITITKPDAPTMHILGYRLMWIADRDGRTLGWGHGHQWAELVDDAFQFLAENVDAELVNHVEIARR